MRRIPDGEYKFISINSYELHLIFFAVFAFYIRLFDFKAVMISDACLFQSSFRSFSFIQDIFRSIWQKTSESTAGSTKHTSTSPR